MDCFDNAWLEERKYGISYEEYYKNEKHTFHVLVGWERDVNVYLKGCEKVNGKKHCIGCMPVSNVEC